MDETEDAEGTLMVLFCSRSPLSVSIALRALSALR